MNTIVIPKEWWASKSVQGVIVGIIAAAYRILARHFKWAEWDSTDTDLVTQLMIAFGFAWTAIGLRTATRPIGNPNAPIVAPATPAGTASGEVPVSNATDVTPKL